MWSKFLWQKKIIKIKIVLFLWVHTGSNICSSLLYTLQHVLEILPDILYQGHVVFYLLALSSFFLCKAFLMLAILPAAALQPLGIASPPQPYNHWQTLCLISLLCWEEKATTAAHGSWKYTVSLVSLQPSSAGVPSCPQSYLGIRKHRQEKQCSRECKSQHWLSCAFIAKVNGGNLWCNCVLPPSSMLKLNKVDLSYWSKS